LLERTAELRAITAAIGAACSGSGTALLIEGPTGIGKTRLLAAASAQAAAMGMTVLTARAGEFEDGYAWGVVRTLFAPGGQSPPGGPPTRGAARPPVTSRPRLPSCWLPGTWRTNGGYAIRR